MRRNAYIILTTLLLLLMAMPPVAAQQDKAADRIKQLTKEMYQRFSEDDYEGLKKVGNELKSESEKVGDDITYYKSWGNIIIKSVEQEGRQQALNMMKELREHAIQHNSKFGLYTSYYTTAHILNMMDDTEGAIENYKKAGEILKANYPKESMAPTYNAIAEVLVQQKKDSLAVVYSQKALSDPYISLLQRRISLSNICQAYGWLGKRAEFDRAYARLSKLEPLSENISDDRRKVEVFRASMNGQHEEAIKQASKMKSRVSRLLYQNKAYEWAGRWEEALTAYKNYRFYQEEVNKKELKEQAKYYQMELNIAQAENESKDLRLRNRRLEQEKLEDELTHKQLETETAKLKLQNMDIELASAAIKHKNDSLEQCTQAALLDEYKLRMEAQRQSEKSHHIMIVAAAAIALLIIGGLSLFQYRRQRQIKQLQCMNERLQTAYDLLKQTTTAKELMESELRIAHDIQTSMVPHDFPERRNIDLYAQLKPAKAVGGDLYDFIFQGDKFYFCIGDVAGKGVPASMLMSATINLFRMTAKEGFPPEYIATKLNDTLSTDNQDGMFVTMFIGVIDMGSGHMDYCNAGHNPPLLDGSFMDVESNAPIGLWPDIEFVGQQVDYVKNKMLFLYTDGISEAENTAQEQFGEERLQALIHLNNMESSRQTIETTIKAVTHFVGDAEQSDDLTMMCIKVTA